MEDLNSNSRGWQGEAGELGKKQQQQTSKRNLQSRQVWRWGSPDLHCRDSGFGEAVTVVGTVRESRMRLPWTH